MGINRIGVNIHTAIARKYKTIIGAARAMGMNRNTLTSYIDRPEHITMRTLYRIAEGLGVSVAELLDGVEEHRSEEAAT